MLGVGKADWLVGARRGLAGLALAAAVVASAPAMAASGDPPYDEQYMRLAEILGGLHHLRSLCGASEPQIWRDKMNALIAAEDPTPDRRRRLIDKFNRSYRSFTEIYRTCTPGAQEIIERYLTEGAKLSEDVLNRYGKR
jgi:uncharacterized protein (TIGR02301 family)